MHAATVGQDAANAVSQSEKNRFRIYFASPVEKGDGPSKSAAADAEPTADAQADAGGESEAAPPQQEEAEPSVADGSVDEDAHSEVLQDGDEAQADEEQDQDEEENQADEAGAEAYLVEEHDEAEQEVAEGSTAATEAPQEETTESATEQKEVTKAESAEATVSKADGDAPKDGDDAAAAAAAAATATQAAAEAAKLAADLKASAENTSAAYGTRATVTKNKPQASEPKQRVFRRSPSLPPTSSDSPALPPNRLSILYGNGTHRLCVDSALVESIRIFRRRGYIQVIANLPGPASTAGGDDHFSGVLIETFDEERNAFMPLAETSDGDVPPLQAANEGQVILTAFLDTDRPLSEPKWVKSGQMEDWIRSVRNGSTSTPARSQQALEKGWEKKLEVVDPDAVSCAACA